MTEGLILTDSQDRLLAETTWDRNVVVVAGAGTGKTTVARLLAERPLANGLVAVGVVFALLFHLVNFAIALFSPTIHALRLHCLRVGVRADDGAATVPAMSIIAAHAALNAVWLLCA